MSTTRLDILRNLRHSHGEVAIVASTYGFDARFFEEYCLETIGAFANSVITCVFIDAAAYDNLICGPTAERPRFANVRYLLTPVHAAGVFHCKFLMVVSNTRGTLFFGSANLTQAGLSINAELVGHYEFELGKHESHRYVFQQVLGFAEELANRSELPSSAGAVTDILHIAPWIGFRGQSESPTIELINNISSPLIEKLRTRIPDPVTKIDVVSRYFDASPRVLDAFLDTFSPERVRIYTDRYGGLTPHWLEHKSVKSGRVTLYLCDYGEGDCVQPLHGKALSLATRNGNYFVFGSPNFSSAALLSTPRSGNCESALLITGAGRRFETEVKRLFDPKAAAVEIRDIHTLPQGEAEPPSSRTSYPLTLREVELNGNAVEVRAEPSADIAGQMSLEIEFGIATRDVVVLFKNGDVLKGVITDRIRNRCNGAVVVTLVCNNPVRGPLRSNPVFLTNLVDPESGAERKKTRHLKQAQRSSEDFIAALTDLIRGNDEELLRAFLEFCDIPLSLAPKFRFGSRKTSDIRDGMRQLGAGNYAICLGLHELAIRFVERHMLKLQRHVNRPELDGIPNFLHIYIAITSVLRSQMERMIQGLESKSGLVTPEEWAECRQKCDIYISLFESASATLWSEYLERLVSRFGSKAVSEHCAPDLQTMDLAYQEVIGIRSRVEQLRLAKTRTPAGCPSGYFFSVFGDRTWKAFSGRVAMAHSAVAGLGRKT